MKKQDISGQKIKILHLYHDIMNLYGEYANILALERILENNNVLYETDKLSVGDSLNLMEYDFIYMGSGTESNQKFILEELQPYRQEMQNYIEAGKMLLMTGNSFEILGKELTDAEKKIYKGLGIFDFTVFEQDKIRQTADAVCLMEGQKRPLVGFINKCSSIYGIKTPLFQIKMGISNEKDQDTEGIRYKNLYGTHLTGPLLIKNPYFLAEIAGILCEKEMDDNYLTYEKAGYEITLRELTKRKDS